MLRNKVRSALLSLTRGRLFIPAHSGIVGRYERKLAWVSATFAYLADLAMLFFGGNLKRKEKINGRFGDILSYMYIAVAVLKQFRVDGSRKEDELLVRYIMKDLFVKIQIAFDGLFDNLFENRFLKIINYPFKIFARINRLDIGPCDKLSHEISKLSLNNDKFRDRMTAGIYISKDKNEALGRLENALDLFRKSEVLIAKLTDNIRAKKLPKKPILQILNDAVKQKIITRTQANIIKSAQEAMNDAVQVDEYSLKDYKKL